MTITWDLLDEGVWGGATITGYMVVAHAVEGGEEYSCSAAANRSRCTITGLRDDTDYDVVAYGLNAVGAGYESRPVTASTTVVRSFWRGWRLDLWRARNGSKEP